MTPVQLQTALAAEGCYAGPIDGRIGAVTLGAIKQFQAEQGLAHTGLVDTATVAALELALHAIPGVPMVPVEAATMIAAWEAVGDGDPKTVLLEPYFDASFYATLGLGHLLLDPNGQRIQAAYRGDPKALDAARAATTALFGQPAITLAQAKALLSIDVNHTVGQIAPLLAGIPTSQKEMDSLVCLAFNIGAKGLSNSTVLARHRTKTPVSRVVNVHLLRTLSEHDKMDSTMEGAFAAWSKSAGCWLLGLFRRRLCEALVYRGDSVDSALLTAKAAV